MGEYLKRMIIATFWVIFICGGLAGIKLYSCYERTFNSSTSSDTEHNDAAVPNVVDSGVAVSSHGSSNQSNQQINKLNHHHHHHVSNDE